MVGAAERTVAGGVLGELREGGEGEKVGGDIGRETLLWLCCVEEPPHSFSAMLQPLPMVAVDEEEGEEEEDWVAVGEVEVRVDVALSNFSAISSPASVSLNLQCHYIIVTSP